ncbi:MAG: zinc-binding dehydrogenase [Erythrobacter sp.]|nr:MAG: zinc-binding dehydrogenase [Erythrobacter sp.]
MKSAEVIAPGSVRMADIHVPEPGEGQVRIRLEGCGVCASNLGPWAGPDWLEFPLPPGDLGHEGWGVVEAVGKGVSEVRVGDRVAALSYRAYAEFDLADAKALLKLPPELEGKPFPGEPLGCAFNIFRRSNIAPGQNVAIIGIGFLGAVLTQLASDAGARVIAISRRPESLELAKHYGAAEVIPMDDHQAIIDATKQLTDGTMCERVIECVGKQWPLDLAGELVAFGGRLVVAGYHQDGPRQVDMQGWNWKGVDVINAHERDLAVQMRGMREAAEAVVSGRLDPAPLYTHIYRLEELGEALDATRDKPPGFVKALVLYP